MPMDKFVTHCMQTHADHRTRCKIDWTANVATKTSPRLAAPLTFGTPLTRVLLPESLVLVVVLVLPLEIACVSVVIVVVVAVEGTDVEVVGGGCSMYKRVES